MNLFDHGGGAQQLAAELGRPTAAILDFSASINPLGIPAGVRSAVLAALDESVHYPESRAESLLAALASHHRLEPRYFLAGNGSTPLFYHAARTLRPRRALVVRPAFSEYERSLLQAGTRVDPLELDPEQGFALDPAELLHRVTPETDLVLLGSPGNPGGVGIPPETVLSLAHALREQALLAVDEAFVDFCPEASVLPRVADHANLLVFRSLTKFYAIPGLRAGYLAGSPPCVANLAAAAEPWSLSTLAIAAARACLDEEEYRRRTLQLIPALRHELAVGLERLGLTVFPSVANYLLARLPAGESAVVAERLRGEGILIRPCGNFPPLDGRYLRVAVRTAAENAILLAELERVLRELQRETPAP